MSDDMMMKIAYKLPGETLIKYCQLSKKFANICSKKYFWIKKYQLDFTDNIPKPISFKDIYIAKIHKNTKLGKFLIEYTNFDDLNFKKQRKYYKDAFSTFDYLYFNCEHDYENESSYIKRDVLESMDDLIYGETHYLSYFGRERIYCTFVDDNFNNNDLLETIVDVSNSITGLNLTYKVAYNINNVNNED